MRNEENPPRSWSCFLSRALVKALSISTVTFLFVRFFLQDQYRFVAVIYYASPWAVISLVSLGALIGWVRAGRRRRAYFFAACFLFSSASWFWTTWFDRGRELDNEPMRVVYWNVGRRKHGIDGMTDSLRRWDADLIGLGEMDIDKLRLQEFVTDGFPNYVASSRFKGMVLMVRGEILEERSHRLPHRGLMKQVRIKVRGKTFVVFLVDLSSNPLLDRGTVLFELAQHVRRCGTEPLIVMGDFNTPPDSVHFRDLRAQMTLAHQRSGSGYAPTWPLPLPVLQIDQIWTNPKVSVTLSRGGWSWLSDHRAIVADFSIED